MEKLYEIGREMQQLLESSTEDGPIVDEVTGEVIVVADKLNAVAELFERKSEDVILYADTYDAQTVAMKARATALLAEVKRREAKSQILREYVAHEMERQGIKKIEGKYCTITLTKTAAAVIDDLGELPFEFVTRKIELIPNKNQIKNAIRSGRTVAGAHLEERKSIRVR